MPSPPHSPLTLLRASFLHPFSPVYRPNVQDCMATLEKREEIVREKRRRVKRNIKKKEERLHVHILIL